MAKFEVGEQVFVKVFGIVVVRGTVHKLVERDAWPVIYEISVSRSDGRRCYPQIFENSMWRTTTQEIVNAWRAEVQGR